MKSPVNRLTERQHEILAYIRRHIRERGYPPTIRQIGHAMGIRSPNGVMCHLRALEAKGWLERDPFVSRAIRVLDPVGESATEAA